jgi:predicted metal-binding membrane protein
MGDQMGATSELAAFGSFVVMWTVMMAAMMLPGSIPVIVGYARTHRWWVAATTVFVTTYVAVWTVFGIASYAVYRSGSTVATVVIAVLAGGYELTPLKRHARRRCQEQVRSGLHLGLWCVGANAGLMMLLLAVGAMNIAWMSVIAAIVLVQKLVPVQRKPKGERHDHTHDRNTGTVAQGSARALGRGESAHAAR